MAILKTDHKRSNWSLWSIGTNVAKSLDFRYATYQIFKSTKRKTSEKPVILTGPLVANDG